MTFVGWGGSDPSSLPDAADYELGTQQTATTGITITHVRVYGAADAGSLANRKGRIWNMSGAVIGTADLPDTLTAGWNLYPLETPVSVNSGDSWVVSYSAIGGYGAETHALDTDVPSANGDVNCPAGTNGRLNFTPGQFPSVGSGNNAFFGIDIGFDEAGTSPPVITSIDTDVTNLSVSATANATDAETLSGATYTFDWGDGSAVTSGSSNVASHTYTSAGLYALLALVEDVTGLSDAAAVPLDLTAPQGVLPPTNDLVARAWVGSVPGIPAGKVATQVPTDASTWAETGFIRVFVVGGSPDPDIAERAPVVQIECWAQNPGSSKPPWGKANHLAELIVAETWRADAGARIVNPGSGYAFAQVQSVTVTSEPRRVPSDTGSYALYQFDVTIRWRHA